MIHDLEIIGEATKKVSEGLRSANPEIPWKRVAGMRDKMVHDYSGVNLHLVWEVVEKDLPTLEHRIAAN